MSCMNVQTRLSPSDAAALTLFSQKSLKSDAPSAASKVRDAATKPSSSTSVATVAVVGAFFAPNMAIFPPKPNAAPQDRLSHLGALPDVVAAPPMAWTCTVRSKEHVPSTAGRVGHHEHW